MNTTEIPFTQEFDYIVVGAGTAGCVLAARLSEDPKQRVCLIEAGGSDRHPFIRIPAGVGAAIMKPSFGWGLWTEPQAALNDRKIPLPRGKVLGGSGSINGMAYYRGVAKDFDDWAAQGNSGWSYAELLPYFLRSEHNPDYPDSPFHNTGGPMGVSFVQQPNRLCESFNQAVEALGFPSCEDFNTANPEGYGYRQGTIWKGRRVSTASAYLSPALHRPNLTVLTNTQSRRVLIDNQRAIGVEIQTSAGVQNLRAQKEVVVSSGAFHSPHLLLNSGIGDSEELQSCGIEPVHHLPAVGKNLQDHPSAFVAMDMDDSTSYGLSWRALPRDIVQCLQYLFARSGPLASNLFETNAYIKTLPDLDRPDMQIVFQPARRNAKLFPVPLGHGYAISVVCLYPQSKGQVRLAGPDPLAAPLIDPALGQQGADIQTLVRGIKLAREIMGQASFNGYQARERLPGSVVSDDQQITDYVKEVLTTVHHPGGTCRMGSAENSVVNCELKVHGLNNLRVADASVYPRLVGGNTNASVVAIAEKAADMMLGKPAPEPIHT